jgi:predicted ArsR family transcriptional regulator
LSQATRARLFQVLGELRRSAGTDELAARLDLHPNGVRAHLEVLTYADLASWLARTIVPTRRRLADLEHSGRTLGRQLAPTAGTAPPEGMMHTVLASLGFQPRRELDVPGMLTYRLCNCPYREIAREHQDVVCTLHRGITRGLLDVIDPATTLTAFVPEEPDTAGCSITLQGGFADRAHPVP